MCCIQPHQVCSACYSNLLYFSHLIYKKKGVLKFPTYIFMVTHIIRLSSTSELPINPSISEVLFLFLSTFELVAHPPSFFLSISSFLLIYIVLLRSCSSSSFFFSQTVFSPLVRSSNFCCSVFQFTDSFLCFFHSAVILVMVFSVLKFLFNSSL